MKLPPTFRPDIEGLRGIGVLLVVAYHAQVPGFGGGFIGVDVFFVLSGYLITRLLVNELDASGRIDLAGFFARRVRRLLPASGLVLLVTAVIGYVVFAPFEHRSLAESALASGAYVSNVYFAYKATDYLGAGGETNPFLHMWSLAVEEQFYLVWPALLVVVAAMSKRIAGRVERRHIVVMMVAVALVSLSLSVWFTDARQPWAFFLAPFRAWEFAVGGIAALLPATGRRWQGPLGWLGLTAVAVSSMTYTAETPFPGIAALVPVLGTAFVLREAERGRLAWALGAPVLRTLGRLSYSWYLWHWPAIVFATALFGDLTLPWRVVVMLVALAIAEATYRSVEHPLRTHVLFAGSRPGRSLAFGAVLTLLSVAGGFGWVLHATASREQPAHVRFAEARRDVPVLYAEGCHRTLFEVTPEPCVYGSATAPMTIALVGDSHAAQWFPALHVIAQERGWRLLSFTKSLCPPVDTTIYVPALQRSYVECESWSADVWEILASIGPDVVVLGAFGGYDVEEDDWLAGMGRSLRSASRVSGEVVFLRPTPIPGFDTVRCVARKAWQEWARGDEACAFAVAEGLTDFHDGELAAADRHPNVTTLDLTNAVCPNPMCTVERGGMMVFRDKDHLTATFARSLAPRIAVHLDAVLARRR